MLAVMLLGQKQHIEDILAENLAKNPYSTGPQLVALVQKGRENTTKQAVYAALRSLLASEVVSKVGHTYFLSRVWLSRVEQLFAAQKVKEMARDAIFDLKEGESISYRFPSLLSCDTYWAHAFQILTEWIHPNVPIMIYMPHEWFAIGRIEVEHGVFKAFDENKKLALFTIGGTSALDKEFKREWKSPFVQTHLTDEHGFDRSYHLHIFDDFLIEVFVGDELTVEIDTFYAQNETLSPENIAAFEALVSKRAPVRMKISRKAKRAAKMRKQLAKHFHVRNALTSAVS